MDDPLAESALDRRLSVPFRPGEMPPLFGDTASVLIVDDEPVVLDLIQSMLGPEGYDCVRATDAEEAMALLEQRDFAVALVDVLLPGDSGLELVDRALSIYPFLAVVMVTGVDDPAIADLALQSGAYGYLVKPFNHNELVVAVSNAGRLRCLEIESAVYRTRLESKLEERTAELDDALMQLKLLHDQAGAHDA